MPKLQTYLLSALRFTAISVWTIVCIFAALLALPITFGRRWPLRIARRVWAPGMLAVSGVRLSVEVSPAARGVIGTRPVIFVMNHQSMMDVPAAFAALRTELHFVAKKELAYLPLVGWYMAAMGMIFVDRRSRETTIRSLSLAARRIREGKSVIAYPEGTRSRGGEVLPFKKGIFLTAIEAGVPIVPVAIEGSARAWPPGTLQLQPGPVALRVGDPVDPADYGFAGREQLVARLHGEVRAMHAELRRRLAEEA